MRTRRTALLAAFIVPACAGGDAPQAVAGGGTAVYCTAGLPEQLNGFVTPDATAANIRWLLFTPLVRYDSTGGLLPWLATAWRWNDERSAVDIALRSDVQWHDGQPVTAEDVAWTVRTAGDATYGYNGPDDFAGLLEAVAITTDTVRLRFDRPLFAGMEPFVHLQILPRHLLDTIPADRFVQSAYHRAPVGSGPFRFVERTVDGNVVLERNDAFPEALGRAQLDRLVLRGIGEVTAQLVELQTGNVDACVMGSSRAAEVEQAGMQALAVPPAALYVLPLDTRQAPLDDARVRRALSAALDRGVLAASLSSVITPARTFLPSGSPWTDASALQPDADSAWAAAALDSAGWRVGDGGMRFNAAGQPLRFDLTAPEALRNLLTVLQSQWRRVGIDANLQFMEGAAYVAAIRNPETRPAAMALSFVPDLLSTPDPYEQLHSTGGSNLASYVNPEADAIAEQLRTPLSDGERAAAYGALQRFAAQDVPIIYLVHAPRMLAVNASLRDVRPDPNGPFASVGGWRKTSMR